MRFPPFPVLSFILYHKFEKSQGIFSKVLLAGGGAGGGRHFLSRKVARPLQKSKNRGGKSAPENKARFFFLFNQQTLFLGQGPARQCNGTATATGRLYNNMESIICQIVCRHGKCTCFVSPNNGKYVAVVGTLKQL